MEMAVSSTAMTIFRKWNYFLLFDNIPSAMYKFSICSKKEAVISVHQSYSSK
jgi:hypothetical protein